jgi:hypothetical protein
MLSYVFETFGLGIALIAIIALIFSNFIPAAYKFPGQLLAVVLICFSLFHLGAANEKKEWAIKVAELEKENAVLEAKSQKVTTQVVVKYVDRIKTIEKEGRVEYVDRYITKENDAACVIPDGFVRLHNDSVEGKVPRTPEGINGSPSEVKLSEVGETVNGNYLTYNKIAEQLSSLQEWVRQQKETFNKERK